MMFSLSVTQQVTVFARSMGLGVIIAAFYISSRIVVSAFAAGKARNIICDCLSCVFGAIALFAFVLCYNLGTLRAYILLGATLGIIATVVFFEKYTEAACERINRISTRCVAVLARPVRRILHFPKRLRDGARKKEENPNKNKKKISKKLSKTIAKRNNDVV